MAAASARRCGGTARSSALASLCVLAGLCSGMPSAPVAVVTDAGACSRSTGGCSAVLGRAPYAPLENHTDAKVVTRYLETCRAHQVLPSGDVLAQLQLGGDQLKLWNGNDFGELQLRTLVLALEDDDGAGLAALRGLDLSGCNLGPSGMLFVAQLLRHPRCRIRDLDVSYQPLGASGAAPIVAALRDYQHLRRLKMHSCGLGDDGGAMMAGLLRNQSASHLESVHLQNNFISFEICSDLMSVAAANDVIINLNGNRVLDEVMNAVTHGIGLCLAIIGTVFILLRTRGKPPFVKKSIVPYCAALITMYLSSTLFHALFATGREAVYVFSVLDYSAIFLLIAGSYTPFLGILFHGERWAMALLAAMWTTAVLGIFTAAFYTGPGAIPLRLVLYLVMGWAAASCIPKVARAIGREGLALFVGGGVLYTAGVPFFARGQHTFMFPDHSIWHIFVVFGTAAHFWCVYSYVIPKAKEAGSADTSCQSEHSSDCEHEGDYERLERQLGKV